MQYLIAQNFTVEKSDEFDEWRAIHQSFPFQSFPCNTSPMKATINLSKFCSSNFLTCLDLSKFRQTFPPSKFCTIRYIKSTVLAYNSSTTRKIPSHCSRQWLVPTLLHDEVTVQVTRKGQTTILLNLYRAFGNKNNHCLTFAELYGCSSKISEGVRSHPSLRSCLWIAVLNNDWYFAQILAVHFNGWGMMKRMVIPLE